MLRGVGREQLPVVSAVRWEQFGDSGARPEPCPCSLSLLPAGSSQRGAGRGLGPVPSQQIETQGRAQWGGGRNREGRRGSRRQREGGSGMNGLQGDGGGEGTNPGGERGTG